LVVEERISMVIPLFLFSFQGNILACSLLSLERPRPPRPPSKQRVGREIRKIEKGESKRSDKDQKQDE